MDDNQVGILVFFGFLAVIFLLILMLPVQGTIFGYVVSMPLLGWITLVFFAIVALYLFFKYRA